MPRQNRCYSKRLTPARACWAKDTPTPPPDSATSPFFSSRQVARKRRGDWPRRRWRPTRESTARHIPRPRKLLRYARRHLPHLTAKQTWLGRPCSFLVPLLDHGTKPTSIPRTGTSAVGSGGAIKSSKTTVLMTGKEIVGALKKATAVA